MKIYLNLDNPIRAFSLKGEHIDELTSVFPSLEAVRVHSTEELFARLGDADFVATWDFPAELYARAPALKAVFTPAAGRERTAADPAGRVSTHYGSFHGMLMAETLLSMILYFNRRLGLLTENKRKRVWDPDALSSCRSLSVQRALIVGYGNIGRACARSLAALGCNVTGVRRTRGSGGKDRNARAVVGPDELMPNLEKADHVVLVLPGGNETTDIFTREHFMRMKKSAYLYNLGRGNCFREEDLVRAIEERTIAGAGLDVFAAEPLPDASPLWGMPNAFIMPHASAIYDDYMDLFLAELIGGLHGLIPGAD